MDGRPRCACCHQEVVLVYVNEAGRAWGVAGGSGSGGGVGLGDDDLSWLKRLVAEDFSASCARDRACGACAVDFCGHCCGEHHRGHDAVKVKEGEAAAEERYRRDSFCIGCGVAFCSGLCAHHGGEGHEVMPIDEYGGRHFARCTGTERWFHHAFEGIETESRV